MPPSLDALGAAGAPSFSAFAFFWQADPVVKAVMAGLTLASVWSWAIIFSKRMILSRLQARSAKFEALFWSGHSPDAVYEKVAKYPQDPMSSIFCAAMAEWRRPGGHGRPFLSQMSETLRQRIERIMGVTLDREIRELEKYTGFLASLGSTAPFVGLFGTVWGIMNSFQAIASAQNTSLTVVAPAIAEALFATALGLVAAIPAVIAYNKIAADLANYGARLESFMHEFSALLSRKMDEEV